MPYLVLPNTQPIFLQCSAMKKMFFPALLVFSTACAVSNQTAMNPVNKLDKQGHRGCRGLLPENTIVAMQKAIDLGVTTLEMDVVITKDQQVILSHEPFFNHEITTRQDGNHVTEGEEKALNIYQMTLAQTRTFDVGLKPHPRFPQQQKTAATKPTLAELIDNIKTYCINKGVTLPHFNIETKTQPVGDDLYHPKPKAFVDLLMAVIKEKQIEEKTIIQSFDFRTLQYLHQQHPHIRTAMLIEDYDKRTLDEQLAALGFIPTIYSPHYSLISKELVDRCHQKGMKVIPWTVNTTDEMKLLVQLGVDGIISDYPNLFAQAGY